MNRGAFANQGDRLADRSPLRPHGVIGGARRNLRVFNLATPQDSAPSAPNTQTIVRADALSLEDINGAPDRIFSVNVLIDTAIVGGPGGMDTVAPVAGNWYHEWVVWDRRARTAFGLFSLSSTVAGLQLPAGYSALRVGSNYYYTNNSVTGFRRKRQFDKHVEFAPTSGSNTPTNPVISSGSVGTYNNATPTWSQVSCSAIVPPNAASIGVIVTGQYNGNANSGIAVAPNNQYLGFSSVSPPPLYTNFGASVAGLACGWFALEGQYVYVAASGTGAGAFALGYDDNL